MERSSVSNNQGASIYAIALGWIVTIAFISLGFQWYLDQQPKPNKESSTYIDRSATSPVNHYDQKNRLISVQIQADRRGHYMVDGHINGHPVKFMVDTGATIISIPSKVANRIGLKPGRPVRVQTAGGNRTAYSVRLNTVEIGNLELRQTLAHINPSFPSDHVLLGMSFLKYFEVKMSNHQMQIAYKY